MLGYMHIMTTCLFVCILVLYVCVEIYWNKQCLALETESGVSL